MLSDGSVGLWVASATAPARLSATSSAPQLRTANRRTASRSASRQSGASSRFGARVATVAMSHPQKSRRARIPHAESAVKRSRGVSCDERARAPAMDRADVIIFGGGLVGLALASALDSSGLSAIVVDPADPGAARRRGVRRPHQRGLVELDADARDDRRCRPSGASRLPDPANRGRRRPRAGRTALRFRRRRAARLHAREPAPSRGAPGARRSGQEHLADVEIARARTSTAASMAWSCRSRTGAS